MSLNEKAQLEDQTALEIVKWLSLAKWMLTLPYLYINLLSPSWHVMGQPSILLDLNLYNDALFDS